MKTVLIAEEGTKVVNLVRLMLTEHMGYRVVATSGGADAVLKAKEIIPDVVLADVSLSDKDGYEVSREIKSDPSLKNTLIILLTSSLETFDETKATEAYADDFIVKPFESEELIKVVESLVTRKKEGARFFINSKRKITFSNLAFALLVTFMIITPIVYKTLDVNSSELESKLRQAYSQLKGLQNINLFNIESKPAPVDDREKKGAISEIISEVRKEENVKKPRPILKPVSPHKPAWSVGKEPPRKEKIMVSQPEEKKAPEELKKARVGKEQPLRVKGEKSKEKDVVALKTGEEQEKQVTERLKLAEQDKAMPLKEAVKEEPTSTKKAGEKESDPEELRYEESLQSGATPGDEDIERGNIEDIKSKLWNSDRGILGPEDINSRKEKAQKKDSGYLSGIKITDWSFFVSFNGVGVIHHVTIENTSDIAYRDIKVRVRYYRTGTEVSWETGVLPVIVFPHSKKTYLEGGTTFGAGAHGMDAKRIEVLGATPMT